MGTVYDTICGGARVQRKDLGFYRELEHTHAL